MHIPEFLHALLRRPYVEVPFVEVKEARLPERSVLGLVSKQIALARVPPFALGQQSAGRALFQDLHHRGGISNPRLGDEQVNLFRHDDISDDHEPVALARLFQNREEAVAAARGAQKRQSPGAGAGDKVQVMSAVSAMQSAGHDQPHGTGSVVPALAQNARAGHPQFRNGYGKYGRLGHPSNNSYYWGGFGNLQSVANGGGTPTCGTSGNCAIYDAFGRLVEYSNGSTWMEIFRMQAGATMNVNGASFIYTVWPTPGGGTVYSGGGAPFYHHKDWIGNARVISNESFPSVYVDRAYTPFGEMYDGFDVVSTGAVEMFASLRSVLDNGVMWDTPNRELSIVGRWLSPDPAGVNAVDPTNPQSWNRYAYVLNNPLSNTDPTGLDCVYLDDPGTAVESIDHNATPADCTGDGNGGYWVPGTIGNASWVTNIDPDSGTIGSYSLLGGSLAWSASTNNDYGIAWGTVDATNYSGSAWNFTKSFFGGFSLSTRSGTCLGVFTDTVSAPLKQLQRSAKDFVPLIVGAMQAGPVGSAWYMSQLNNMVASGAAEADPQVAAVVTTAGAAAATAAPYVSAAAPYVAPAGADALLLNGVIKEVQSGMSGHCTW